MSTLDIVTLAGIALVLVLGLIAVIGGVVWFLRRRHDEEEDTTDTDTDPDADGDTDGDGNPAHNPEADTPELQRVYTYEQRVAADAIAALDTTIYMGVKAMLEKADGELVRGFKRDVINPLRQSMFWTTSVLVVIILCLAGAMSALWVTRLTEDDLDNHGATWSADASRRITLAERLDAIEAWQTENTVTSPLVHANGVIPPQRSFTSLQDLLMQLSEFSSRLGGAYKELDGNFEAMVPYLDCYTERTSNTPDENGCYDLTCTLDMRTFTRPHRYDYTTSSWSPCD